MVISVPGNILLLGEYAVLEEGGLGFALAAEPRVHVESRPAASLCIEGAWPGGAVRWTPGEPAGSPLCAAVVAVVQERLARRGAPFPEGRRVHIDSSGFFRADGRKSGLGSSAAVTVGLVCALLDAAGAGTDPLEAAAALLAVDAHRRAQGGAGSGYDVTCSFHGGTGVFRGGHRPSWEARRLPFAARILLFHGNAPVVTSAAVSRYRAWKEQNGDEALAFLEESNRNVMAFMAAGTIGEAARAITACRRCGVRLGEAIGVPAAMETPPGLDPALCKAVGAGNELGVCLAAGGPPAEGADGPAPGVERVIVSERGVAWTR